MAAKSSDNPVSSLKLCNLSQTAAVQDFKGSSDSDSADDTALVIDEEFAANSIDEHFTKNSQLDHRYIKEIQPVSKQKKFKVSQNGLIPMDGQHAKGVSRGCQTEIYDSLKELTKNKLHSNTGSHSNIKTTPRKKQAVFCDTTYQGSPLPVAHVSSECHSFRNITSFRKRYKYVNNITNLTNRKNVVFCKVNKKKISAALLLLENSAEKTSSGLAYEKVSYGNTDLLLRNVRHKEHIQQERNAPFTSTARISVNNSVLDHSNSRETDKFTIASSTVHQNETLDPFTCIQDVEIASEEVVSAVETEVDTSKNIECSSTEKKAKILKKFSPNGSLEEESCCSKCGHVFDDSYIYSIRSRLCTLPEHALSNEETDKVIVKSVFNRADLLKNIANDHIYSGDIETDLTSQNFDEDDNIDYVNKVQINPNNPVHDVEMDEDDEEFHLPDVIVEQNYCIDENVTYIDSDDEYANETSEAGEIETVDIKPDVHDLELMIKKEKEKTGDTRNECDSEKGESGNLAELPDIKPDIKIEYVGPDTCEELEVKSTICHHCLEIFKSTEAYDTHLPSCLKNYKKGCYCKICRQAFVDRKALNTHECVREKGMTDYTCSVCDKSFQKHYVAVAHMKTHSGRREFICEVCQKSFLLKHHLKDHLKSHNNDRPFKCQVCSAAFKRQGHLQKHQNSHKADRERKFKCHYCDASFFDKDNIKRHEDTHKCTSERFVCEICHCTYRGKNALKKHVINIHEGGSETAGERLKRQLECPICASTFFMKKHLLAHLKSHKDEIGSDVLDTLDVEDIDSNVLPVKKDKKWRKVKCKICCKPMIAANMPHHIKKIHGEESDDSSD